MQGYICIIIMKSVLLRQFIQGRSQSYLSNYMKFFGHKSQMVLDTIIPDAFDNLLNSTDAFIDGLINLDEDFVASTATPQLQSILIPQINKLKASHAQIKKIQNQQVQKQYAKLVVEKGKQAADQYINNPNNFKRLLVSPYVIFGQTMEQRFRKTNPWQKLVRLGSNRFISLEGGFQKIRNDHVYGFHCFYIDISLNYEVSEGTLTQRSGRRQFQVSFETNSDNLEFFVSDFNNLVQKQL